MVEIVIIAESIIASIIWWIYIDKFHFACETVTESIECNEIIAFDEEIGAKLSLTIEELNLLGTRDLMISARVDTAKTRQYLSLLKCVDI